MFLVQDSSLSREDRIKQFLTDDPSLLALLSVIHFEWTVRRAMIALGASPNVIVRAKLKNCHRIDRYKDVWKDEVFQNDKLKVQQRLPETVQDWNGLCRAFRLRHRLVHGTTSCGAEYAKERVHWAIAAANDVRAVCSDNGINLDSRLPIRRLIKSKSF